MPIDSDSFDRGRTTDSLTDRAWEFLSAHPDQAFTAEEVAIEIGHVRREAPSGLIPALMRSAAVLDIQQMLNDWARKNLVEAKDVEIADRTQRYYRVNPARVGVTWS